MAAHPALLPTKQAEWSPMKGGLPLAALAGGFLLYQGLKSKQRQDQAGAVQKGLDQRASNAAHNAGVVSSLRGGAPLDSVGAAIYNNERAASGEIGDTFMFDKGAAASIVESGRLLAKHAGIGGAVLGALGKMNQLPGAALKGVQAVTKPVVSRLPSMGLGTKAVLGAGALGVGYGAMKAGKGLYNYGMKPTETRTWGGHHAALPQYTNQFGVPEMG